MFDLCHLIQRFKSFNFAQVFWGTVQTDRCRYKSKVGERVRSSVLQVAWRCQRLGISRWCLLLGVEMKKFGMLALCCVMGTSHAYDGVSSELSHAAGGALLAGAVTRFYSESDNRAWIGFAVSTAGIVISESYQIAHGAKRSSSLLDVASHAAGSALGAWWTDKYYLMPVIGPKSVGLVFTRQF